MCAREKTESVVMKIDNEQNLNLTVKFMKTYNEVIAI